MDEIKGCDNVFDEAWHNGTNSSSDSDIQYHALSSTNGVFGDV